MNIKIHRGTHQIGGTCIELSTSKTRILLDFGLPLVNPKNKDQRLDIKNLDKLLAKELLSEGILPKISGLYHANENCAIDGIIISHPHQDHYGLMGKVRKDIPVYMGKYAKNLFDASDIFLLLKTQIKNSVIMSPKKKFTIGDIKITPCLMDHSAFDSMSFLIEADNKRIFYSGDFRAHGRKSKLYDAFIKNPPKDIDILLMEGTVIGSSSHLALTESQIEEQIISSAKQYKGVKLINTSGQNIDRIVSFYRAAIRTNSYLVLDLYTAFVLHSLDYKNIPHPDKNYKNLRLLYTYNYSSKIAGAGHEKLLFKWNKYKIKPFEMGKNPGKYFVFYRNSIKQYIKGIKNFADSVMIYSMWGGYQKEKSFNPTNNFLEKNKIKMESIHTSGHASETHLKQFANAIKPKILIPIHTFYPEKFKRLYKNIKFLKDGLEYKF